MPGDGSILLKKRLCPDPPVPPSFSLPMGTGSFASLTDCWAGGTDPSADRAAAMAAGAAGVAPLFGRAPLGEARESTAAKVRGGFRSGTGAGDATHSHATPPHLWLGSLLLNGAKGHTRREESSRHSLTVSYRLTAVRRRRRAHGGGGGLRGSDRESHRRGPVQVRRT